MSKKTKMLRALVKAAEFIQGFKGAPEPDDGGESEAFNAEVDELLGDINLAIDSTVPAKHIEAVFDYAEAREAPGHLTEIVESDRSGRVMLLATSPAEGAALRKFYKELYERGYICLARDREYVLYAPTGVVAIVPYDDIEIGDIVRDVEFEDKWLLVKSQESGFHGFYYAVSHHPKPIAPVPPAPGCPFDEQL